MRAAATISPAASASAFDKADPTAYTDAVLKWWRENCGGFKQWALAARIVFAISPNSASCERVFSLLKLMYGDQQLSTRLQMRSALYSCCATTTEWWAECQRSTWDVAERNGSERNGSTALVCTYLVAASMWRGAERTVGL